MGGKAIRCWLRKIGSRLFKKSFNPNTVLDTIDLKLWGLSIHVTRELPADVPYELTIVVPRTELRKNCTTATAQKCGLEILLNSITIAHSPRLEGTEPKSPPKIPVSAKPNQEPRDTSKPG